MNNKSIPYLKPINSTSVVQRVIDSLTEAMISKQLRPGDKIPTEIELANTLGVGRNSIREAIKILVYLGVLEIRRAEGTFVCEGFSESMIDPMLYGIILDTSNSYENLIELREIMEVSVVQLALKKRTPEDLGQIRQVMADMKSAVQQTPPNISLFFEADNQFHDLISQAGHNPLMDKINRVVRALTHSVRLESVTYMMESGRGQELYDCHEELYHLVESKNKENLDLNTVIRATYFYQPE